MAALYVTEFTGLRETGKGIPAQVAQTPPVASHKITIAATAASITFSRRTDIIRVHTDAVCSILIGSNPTATASDGRMAADATEYFGVRPGDKLSVISNT